MRTSLNETKQIDDYLFKYAGEADALLFEAKLILQPHLQENLLWQKRTYEIIRQYSRRQLKAEIAAVHQRLFNEPEHTSFRRKIMAFFSKH
jgi:hypothetical protein